MVGSARLFAGPSVKDSRVVRKAISRNGEDGHYCSTTLLKTLWLFIDSVLDPRTVCLSSGQYSITVFSIQYLTVSWLHSSVQFSAI